MEGDYDASHASFLHSTLDQGQANNPALQASGGRLQFADRMPRYVSLEDTPSGLMMVSSAKRADGRLQYSAGPWMMPIFCTAGVASPGIYSSNLCIPIDDENLMFYRLRWSYDSLPESARLVVEADTPVEQAVAEVEALAMQKSGQATMLIR